MIQLFRISKVALLAACLPAVFSGCAHMNNTQSGALVGSGIGGLGGAIVGNATGNTGAGAVIGALGGGLVGAMAGNAEDAREQRDAALARAHYAETQAAAMTNIDVIKMAQSGVGDAVIVQAVQSRGGRFDLSADGIIAMRNAGVSDHVLVEIQKIGQSPAPTTVVSGQTYVASPQPNVVIVRPEPVVRFGVSVRPRRRHWHPRRRHVHVHHWNW